MVAIETVPLTPEKVKRVALFQIFFNWSFGPQDLWAKTATNHNKANAKHGRC